MQNKIVDFAIFTRDEFIEWQKAEKRYLSAIQPITTGVKMTGEGSRIDASCGVSVFVTFFVDP